MKSSISHIYFKFSSLLFELINPKGKYFRLMLAFAIGMVFRILLMEIEIFANFINNSKFTYFLSVNLVKISHFIFNLFGVTVSSHERNIALYDTVGVLVNDSCLGLRGIILFTFFIIAYHGIVYKKIVFIVFGFTALELGNIIRICALATVQYCCPEKFDFVHFYLSKVIFYSIILGLWIYWIEKIVKIDYSK